MTGKVEHCTKRKKRDTLNTIVKLLYYDGDFRNMDIKKRLSEMKIPFSDPSLSGWLSTLEELGRIEHYYKPGGDRREKWYRIVPRNRKKVESQLCRNKAISFLESLSNAAHVYDESGSKAAAAFMSITSEDMRSVAEKNMRNIVKWALRVPNLPNLLKSDGNKRIKVAVVIMTGVKP